MTNNELRLLARTIILEESQIYQNPNLIEALSGVNTKELTKLQSESDQIIKTAITCYEEVKKQELQNHNQDIFSNSYPKPVISLKRIVLVIHKQNIVYTILSI